MERFKFLEHTADVKFQAFGSSLEETFANAGLALTNIICKEKIGGKKKKIIRVKARDRSSLVYDFLEEILYLLEVGEFIVAEIKNVEIQGVLGRMDKKRNMRFRELELFAELIGDSSENYELESHVKAITYNDMFVKKDKDKFVIQVVVDV